MNMTALPEFCGKRYTVILETSRLVLREMQQSDYSNLCNILQDADVMYAYEGAFSDIETQELLDKQISSYLEYGFGLWAVLLITTGEMIGLCGLTMQNYLDTQVLEVGYLFQKAYWRHGYATEAAIACRDYAFEKLNADEVFSIIRDDNIASQNVAKRNGMTVADTFIKHYRGVNMPHYLFSVKHSV
jgi:RimJ/RimL family protein N-acetyltransferase